MKLWGWVFMLSSAALVWGMTGYCFYRVFTLPPEKEPAEPVHEFHSA